MNHALEGVRDMIATEPNAWIHAIVTVAVLSVSWWLEIRETQLAVVVLAIMGVWVAEAFNTVLEIMANLTVGERYSSKVKRAKDIAAGGVLIACFGAAVIGFIIIGPPLFERIGG
jgi:diacylglycerol kinase